MSGYCGSEDVLQSRHRGRESDSTDDHNKKKTAKIGCHILGRGET